MNENVSKPKKNRLKKKDAVSSEGGVTSVDQFKSMFSNLRWNLEETVASKKPKHPKHKLEESSSVTSKQKPTSEAKNTSAQSILKEQRTTKVTDTDVILLSDDDTPIVTASEHTTRTRLTTAQNKQNRKKSISPRNGSGRGGRSRKGKGRTISQSVQEKPLEDDVVELLDDSGNWDINELLNPINAANLSYSSLPFTVRVRWKNEILRFTVKESDSCYALRQLIGKKIDLHPSEFEIYFDDCDRRFRDVQSLKEAGIGFGSILEVNRLLESEKMANLQSFPQKDLIRLKIQTKDKRGDGFFSIGRNSPLRELILSYCIKNSISENSVKLRFDGECVDLTETPNGLDLEGDECFDVINL